MFLVILFSCVTDLKCHFQLFLYSRMSNKKEASAKYLFFTLLRICPLFVLYIWKVSCNTLSSFRGTPLSSRMHLNMTRPVVTS